jgi:hypothetical protein
MQDVDALNHQDIARINDLAAALGDAWARLEEGVRNRRSPFHSPMAATIGLDGQPRARVVILRGCEPAERSLRFHTDRRSDKIAELIRQPRIALTAYDAAAKVQVRAEGQASLHKDDAVADAAWDGSRVFSRICYGAEPGPGSELAGPGAFRLPADEAEIAAGRAHFCAVRIVVERLEWLYLAHEGHRRARFDVASGANGVWLSP